MPTDADAEVTYEAAYQTLRLCNCARCGCELRAPRQKSLILRLRQFDKDAKIPELLAARINDRPFCAECLKSTECLKIAGVSSC